MGGGPFRLLHRVCPPPPGEVHICSSPTKIGSPKRLSIERDVSAHDSLRELRVCQHDDREEEVHAPNWCDADAGGEEDILDVWRVDDKEHDKEGDEDTDYGRVVCKHGVLEDGRDARLAQPHVPAAEGGIKAGVQQGRI